MKPSSHSQAGAVASSSRPYRMLVFLDLTCERGIRAACFPFLFRLAKMPQLEVFVAPEHLPANQDLYAGKEGCTFDVWQVDSTRDTFKPLKPVGSQQHLRVMETQDTLFDSRVVARSVTLKQFDCYFLRLFVNEKEYRKALVTLLSKPDFIHRTINNPKGSAIVGDKSFLMNPICHSITSSTRDIKSKNDLLGAKKDMNRFILKPCWGSGGKGVMQVHGNEVSESGRTASFDDVLPEILADLAEHKNYVAVEFLKNVSQGDKRVIIINGKIMGCSLRIPQSGNWLCNGSQGGSSHHTTPTEEEQHMVEVLAPKLRELGIVMCGMDTLVGNDGKRVLSELNCWCVGGLVFARTNMVDPQESKSVLLPAAREMLVWITENVSQRTTVDPFCTLEVPSVTPSPPPTSRSVSSTSHSSRRCAASKPPQSKLATERPIRVNFPVVQKRTKEAPVNFWRKHGANLGFLLLFIMCLMGIYSFMFKMFKTEGSYASDVGQGVASNARSLP